MRQELLSLLRPEQAVEGIRERGRSGEKVNCSEGAREAGLGRLPLCGGWSLARRAGAPDPAVADCGETDTPTGLRPPLLCTAAHAPEGEARAETGKPEIAEDEQCSSLPDCAPAAPGEEGGRTPTAPSGHLPRWGRQDLFPQGGGGDGCPDSGLRRHYESLLSQGQELAEEFPEFDPAQALRDPELLRLTAPGLGIDLRRAWLALHPEALRRRAAEDSRELLARALASGAARPREGGGQNPALIAADYRSLSRREQLELKRRITEAAARGEKIYP